MNTYISLAVILMVCLLVASILMQVKGAGGGLFGGGGGAAGGFGSYENTAIGQIIVLAYLNAYTDMVTQLGGLPLDAAAAAPEAR